jgi:thymidylate synthase (FAD)
MNIIKAGHESVLEHCSITVRFIGDRSMSHQLVRHRIAAYSLESQRYCDYGKDGFQVVLPPSIGKLPAGTYVKDSCGWLFALGDYHIDQDDQSYFQAIDWLHQVGSAYETYLNLRTNGVLPEDARSVLPNCTKTEVVTTFNLRQWRHVFRDRALNPRAQWQIRELMQSTLEIFFRMLPCVFGDLLKC